MNDADDVMIVDKILSHRKRKVKVKKKSVSEEDATKQSKDSGTSEIRLFLYPFLRLSVCSTL